MDDRRGTGDEARRVAQHTSTRSRVDRGLHPELAVQGAYRSPGEYQAMTDVNTMRARNIDPVMDREVRPSPGLARVSQVVDYVFGVVYVLLGIRLVLAFIAAESSSGFVRFIHTVTAPLYNMFRGIVASPTVEGGTLALPVVVAIVAYAVLHAGIKGLLRLIAHRRTEI